MSENKEEEPVMSTGDAAANSNPEEGAVSSNADNGKMSSKSSDISIEEIGPEEAAIEKSDNAEVLLPEPEPEPVREVIEEIPRDPEPPVPGLDDDDDEDDDDDDDFEDETVVERLMGLTEMFPDGLTNMVCSSTSGMISGLQWAYGATRTLTWVVCSSATIMFLPIMIETERMGIEEAQKQQQRQILLGPGAAMSGGNAQTNAPLPQAAA